jgi:hypothetical protein
VDEVKAQFEHEVKVLRFVVAAAAADWLARRSSLLTAPPSK